MSVNEILCNLTMEKIMNTGQSLAEVYGHPVDNNNHDACRSRKIRFCPYNNRVPNCTKERANEPMGVCSVFDNQQATIICPIRFRENWLIIENAAKLYFSENVRWTTITDVKLYDKFNTLVDTIEFVIVSFDDKGNIIDFLSVDTQAAFVNRNIRKKYNSYIENPAQYLLKIFKEETFVDYTSAIHQKIAPQLIYRGSIFHAWNKKAVLVIDEGLLNSLPKFTEVPKENADIIWLVYGLELNAQLNKYELKLKQTIFTLFEPTLFQITRVEPGELGDFVAELQSCLDNHLNTGYPPDAPTLMDIVFKE